MLSDFYFRPADDPNYLSDIQHIHDEVEEAVYQTKMTLLTNKGEVLGEPNFGFNAEDYLFDLGPIDPALVENRAAAQLKGYALAAKKYDVNVKSFMYSLNNYTNVLGLDIRLGELGSFGVLFS